MTDSSPKSARSRSLSRATRLVLIGGVASGAAFAAVTGISSAASSTPSASTSSTSTTTPSAPAGPRSGRGFPGGPGFGHAGPGAFGGPGGGGTVTAINGTTLTLRTEAGTETVTTTSSTTFTKELQTVSLSTVKVGDVVHVMGPRPAAGATAAPEASSGTGTVAASRVTIVEPSFTGRVQSVDAGGYTLVGPDGQLLTVSTTGSTAYYNGTTKAAASAVTAGTYITAEGTQDTLTHLSADAVSVRPAAGSRPTAGDPRGPGGWDGAAPGGASAGSGTGASA